MYTLVDRIGSGNKPDRKRQSAIRFPMGSFFGTYIKSIRHPPPVVHSTVEMKSDISCETPIKGESILLIYLNLQCEFTSDFPTSLRAINDEVQVYTNTSLCLDFIRTVHDRIFFITSSVDQQLIEEFHSLKSIEAMFILNTDINLSRRLPKLYGVYPHTEELLTALRNALEWFEYNQLEPFVFEENGLFLWSQLWKEEFIKQQNWTVTSNKETFIRFAVNYYEENIKMRQAIDEFNQCYLQGDALQWCFTSPFPSRLLHRALRSPNFEHLQACRFLLIQASRHMELANRKSSCELYKGMKMTEEFMEKFDRCIGKLICSKGFFLCNQSRKTALTIANSSDHRTDLKPVLFKITYDQSVSLGELSQGDSSPFMVFDVYTVFRVKYVNHGEITTIKLELADDEGKKFAQTYRAKHQAESAPSLLNQLISPHKPPARLPPLQRVSVVPSPRTSVEASPNDISLSMISEDDDETRAQELIERGQIDQALEIYLRWRPQSARVLNTIAVIYAEKKGDYESAIEYFKKALTLQEAAGEDVSSTLAQIGIIHQSLRQFDLALSYHSRVLEMRKHTPHIDQTSVASSLIGIANAYWGQQNLPEALKYAEEALALNQSIERGNDTNIATNLAIIANIHYNGGDSAQALEIATRALGLFEQSGSQDSLALATLYNNVATMQVVEGLFAEARYSYTKGLEICQKNLPEGHPKRTLMEVNIERVLAMEAEQYANPS